MKIINLLFLLFINTLLVGCFSGTENNVPPPQLAFVLLDKDSTTLISSDKFNIEVGTLDVSNRFSVNNSRITRINITSVKEKQLLFADVTTHPISETFYIRTIFGIDKITVIPRVKNLSEGRYEKVFFNDREITQRLEKPLDYIYVFHRN